MLKISLDRLDDFFARVASEQSLYMPVDREDGQAEFRKWTEGSKLSQRLNTVRSAKDFFFPQTENLVDFKMQGKNIEVLDTREECEDFAVFGVRACDARSFSILDKVFLCEPVDSYYKNRREHGVIISLSCTRPAETCFCTVFGIDPVEPEGDISCSTDGKSMFFKVNTPKGEEFVKKFADVFEDGDPAQLEKMKEFSRNVFKKLPLANLSTDSFGGDKMMKLFNSPKWAELSEACIGCGTCTFICPTCQCYDIRDFKTNDGVKRFRCWDSCMYSEFTKMAHGNPRVSQLERFRQRFMHKLVYFPSNNDGEFGCVGCGRCLTKCPSSINIVKVMKALEVEE